MSAPLLPLNDGNKLPQVGFGLWKVDNPVAADAVYNAIKAGYRLFDGACDYGNEVECGQGVARAIEEGLVKREDLFIVSKLWNSFHDYDKVEPIVKKQLADWGVDYFDLYYIHFPISLEYVDPKVRYPPGWFYDGEKEVRYGKATLESTWKAMEEIKKKGLSKSIGVSNYNTIALLDLFTYATVKPAVVQVEHHPYLVQQPLLNLCKEHNIQLTGYSSFGPQSFRDCGMDLANDIPLLFDQPAIKKIAEKHGKTTAQILLRWSTQRGVAVIPKSITPRYMKQNLDVTGFDLAPEEIKEITGLDKNLRFNAPYNYGIPIWALA